MDFLLLAAMLACTEFGAVRAAIDCSSQNLSVAELRKCAKTAAAAASDLRTATKSASSGKYCLQCAAPWPLCATVRGCRGDRHAQNCLHA